MKKLMAIDKTIELLDGNVATPGQKLPTFRFLIQTILNNQVPKNADESLDINQVLLKLRQVESDIELENAEFKALKEKAGENQAKMFQGPHGQLLAYLNACEKESEKK